GAGNDFLHGGAGFDIDQGGAGNDSYIFSDVADAVIENPGEGTDTVSTNLDYTLPANVENLIMAGPQTFGTGNELANLIVGNAGANVIDGRGGADTLIGGAGDDTYIVGNSITTIIENAGGGFDTVLVSAAFQMPDNIEKAVLTSTVGTTIWGNAS